LIPVETAGKCNYNVYMRAKLVQIGNSKGLRVPKAILDQCGLKDDVELLVEGARLIIQPVSEPREGWDEAFAEMAACGDDALLDAEAVHAPSAWEEAEWEW